MKIVKMVDTGAMRKLMWVDIFVGVIAGLWLALKAELPWYSAIGLIIACSVAFFSIAGFLTFIVGTASHNERRRLNGTIIMYNGVFMAPMITLVCYLLCLLVK